MIWYLEQQLDSCYGMETRKSMLKVIQATRKSIPQFRDQYFGNLGVEETFLTRLQKNKNANSKNALIGSIF